MSLTLAISCGSRAHELVKYRGEMTLAFESQVGGNFRKRGGGCFQHAPRPRHALAQHELMWRQADRLFEEAREAARAYGHDRPKFSHGKIVGEVLLDIIKHQPQTARPNAAFAQVKD